MRGEVGGADRGQTSHDAPWISPGCPPSTGDPPTSLSRERLQSAYPSELPRAVARRTSYCRTSSRSFPRSTGASSSSHMRDTEDRFPFSLASFRLSTKKAAGVSARSFSAQYGRSAELLHNSLHGRGSNVKRKSNFTSAGCVREEHEAPSRTLQPSREAACRPSVRGFLRELRRSRRASRPSGASWSR